MSLLSRNFVLLRQIVQQEMKQEPIQQEQQVINYLKKNGRKTIKVQVKYQNTLSNYLPLDHYRMVMLQWRSMTRLKHQIKHQLKNFNTMKVSAKIQYKV